MTTGIEFTREEVKKWMPRWFEIRDITEAENLPKYIRRLNPHDNSEENEERNRQYQDNAVFYGIAGYTAQGLTGTVFRRDPRLIVPPQLEYLLSNADGAGNSLYQQAQDVVHDVVRYGRAGVMTLFPNSEGEITQADMDRLFATVHNVQPWQIINWRVGSDGARTRLTLVVILSHEERPDGYGLEEIEVIHEMALEDGFYVQRRWENNAGWEVVEEFSPRDASGNRLTEIPFTFVGARNNDADIDQPPLKHLVEINIGHYRNSADYEDSVFYCGQAQPWMSGADEQYMELMERSKFYIGSRVLMPVPEGGTFAFASADPNPLVRQAMLDKVDQMIGLGARFIEAGGSAKTATEAEGDSMVQHSVLSLIAVNVSEAYARALEWVALYMGTETPEFALDQDFSHVSASPNEMAVLIQGFVQGVVPSTDVWKWMQRNGYIDPDKTPEEIAEELETITQL